MLSERGPAAVSAWQTLFGQITSTIEVPFDAGEGEEPHTIDRLLAHVRDPRRELRQRTLEALYAALEPHSSVLAHTYDTLIPMFSDSGKFDAKAMAVLAKSYVELKVLPSEPDPKALVDERFLPGK